MLTRPKPRNILSRKAIQVFEFDHLLTLGWIASLRGSTSHMHARDLVISLDVTLTVGYNYILRFLWHRFLQACICVVHIQTGLSLERTTSLNGYWCDIWYKIPIVLLYCNTKLRQGFDLLMNISDVWGHGGKMLSPHLRVIAFWLYT